MRKLKLALALTLVAGAVSAGTYFRETQVVTNTTTTGNAITNRSSTVFYPISITVRASRSVTGIVSVSRIDGAGNSNILFSLSATNFITTSGGPDYLFPIRRNESLRVDDSVTNSLVIGISSEFYP